MSTEIGRRFVLGIRKQYVSNSLRKPATREEKRLKCNEIIMEEEEELLLDEVDDNVEEHD